MSPSSRYEAASYNTLNPHRVELSLPLASFAYGTPPMAAPIRSHFETRPRRNVRVPRRNTKRPAIDPARHHGKHRAYPTTDGHGAASELQLVTHVAVC